MQSVRKQLYSGYGRFAFHSVRGRVERETSKQTIVFCFYNFSLLYCQQTPDIIHIDIISRSSILAVVLACATVRAIYSIEITCIDIKTNPRECPARSRQFADSIYAKYERPIMHINHCASRSFSLCLRARQQRKRRTRILYSAGTLLLAAAHDSSPVTVLCVQCRVEQQQRARDAQCNFALETKLKKKKKQTIYYLVQKRRCEIRDTCCNAPRSSKFNYAKAYYMIG
uniref:Uncharacterized protein n=1 Tax=Trichogramma kaykai TaxID=54128 RepID=A0ABD2X5A9_9HYME